MTKPIYILGAGAIGKALAVFLTLDHKPVVLLRSSVDNVARSRETIQVIRSDNTALDATIDISTLSDFQELDGIVVLTNKSYGNEKLAQILTAKIGHSPLVILQNGLGIEQPFLDANFPAVYRCVLLATSQVISSGKLRFKPVSESPIGAVKGSDEVAEEIAAQLNTPIFPFKAEQAIQPIIWKKAIVNSVFNSICPLLDVDNGVFQRDDRALSMAKRVINECATIAAATGVYVNTDEIVASLLAISSASDGQLISTLQDINNNRRTEIDTLNLEIVRLAASMNKEHVVTETKLLGELISLKSALRLMA